MFLRNKNLLKPDWILLLLLLLLPYSIHHSAKVTKYESYYGANVQINIHKPRIDTSGTRLLASRLASPCQPRRASQSETPPLHINEMRLRHSIIAKRVSPPPAAADWPAGTHCTFSNHSKIPVWTLPHANQLRRCLFSQRFIRFIVSDAVVEQNNPAYVYGVKVTRNAISCAIIRGFPPPPLMVSRCVRVILGSGFEMHRRGVVLLTCKENGDWTSGRMCCVFACFGSL